MLATRFRQPIPWSEHPPISSPPSMTTKLYSVEGCGPDVPAIFRLSSAQLRKCHYGDPKGATSSQFELASRTTADAGTLGGQKPRQGVIRRSNRRQKITNRNG